MSISSGDVELNARVTQKQKTQTLAGNLTLTNFNGRIGNSEFLGYSSQLKLDVASSPEQIQINQIAGSFSQNGNSGGNFDISGIYKPANKSADMNIKLSGVNENALRPFLEPALAGKKLKSVVINGTVSGQYNPQAASAVKANVQVANLVVNDPAKKNPGDAARRRPASGCRVEPANQNRRCAPASNRADAHRARDQPVSVSAVTWIFPKPTRFRAISSSPPIRSRTRRGESPAEPTPRQNNRRRRAGCVRQCRPGTAGGHSAISEFHGGGGHRPALFARSGHFQFRDDREN